MTKRRDVLAALGGAALGSAAFGPRLAFAQADYPARPVTIIVPFPAGNSGDILSRTLADALSKEWGRSVIVDNKPGAGGSVGAQYVIHAAPDGYTLLHGSSGPVAMAPHINKSAAYDPRKDFTPIMNVAGVSQAFVVRADSPFKTLRDMLDRARANPGKLNCGSGGTGSTQHLTLELLKQRAGVNVTHVPYKGAAPAYTDLMGGAVDFVVDSLPASLSFVQAKQMRVLAVSTPKRDSALPDVPTVQESGVADFDVLGWLAIVGPAGMNPAIRDKINAGLKKVLAIDSVRQSLTKLGMQIVGNSPDEFGRFIASEYLRWGEVVKQAGIKGE